MHGEIMPLALDMERRLFAQISAAELKQFKGLLTRITHRVAELEAETKELS
jgi:coenzyme F420-reducing hydrogenase delta subunit